MSKLNFENWLEDMTWEFNNDFLGTKSRAIDDLLAKQFQIVKVIDIKE